MSKFNYSFPEYLSWINPINSFHIRSPWTGTCPHNRHKNLCRTLYYLTPAVQEYNAIWTSIGNTDCKCNRPLRWSPADIQHGGIWVHHHKVHIVYSPRMSLRKNELQQFKPLAPPQFGPSSSLVAYYPSLTTYCSPHEWKSLHKPLDNAVNDFIFVSWSHIVNACHPSRNR